MRAKCAPIAMAQAGAHTYKNYPPTDERDKTVTQKTASNRKSMIFLAHVRKILYLCTQFCVQGANK
jgi:hypothetical protein